MPVDLKDIVPVSRLPWEKLADAEGCKPWQVAAVRAFHKLVAGQEMTAAEFRARLERVLSERYGY